MIGFSLEPLWLKKKKCYKPNDQYSYEIIAYTPIPILHLEWINDDPNTMYLDWYSVQILITRRGGYILLYSRLQASTKNPDSDINIYPFSTEYVNEQSISTSKIDKTLFLL